MALFFITRAIERFIVKILLHEYIQSYVIQGPREMKDAISSA